MVGATKAMNQQLFWEVAGATRKDGTYALPDSVREPCGGDCLAGRDPVKESLLVVCRGGQYHLPGCFGYTPTQDLAVLLAASRQVKVYHAGTPEDLPVISDYGREWWIVWYPCPVAEHDHRSDFQAWWREDRRTCARGESGSLTEAIYLALKGVLVATECEMGKAPKEGG